MDWMNGPNPYRGVSSPGQDFPSVLPLNEASDWVEETGPAEVLLGVDGSGKPVTVDLDSESPHILVNAQTGAGKSAVARSVAVQRMARGDVVVFLDRKMHSHRWARGLAPNAFYADDVPSIAGALYDLGRELKRRNTAVRDGGPEALASEYRIVVVFEELNATLRELKALDKQVGAGSGSMDALADILFMGRAVKMHLVGFAQLASYRSGMTQDLIENFGTRVMIQYSDKAWKWLASDCGRYRLAPAEDGRGMVCYRGKAQESQLLWVPEESAAEFVTASVPAQRRARELSGTRANLPQVWRQSVGR